MTTETNNTLTKGAIGIGSSLGGLSMSLAQVEAWLRITSLTIGICVGLATLYTILRRKR